jgi:hypothetical protein
MVESQPSKLRCDSTCESQRVFLRCGRFFGRVWPKGWAVAFQATHTGSIPVTRSIAVQSVKDRLCSRKTGQAVIKPIGLNGDGMSGLVAEV